MKIGIGLPNQVRGTRPTVIPDWAARAEQAGFSTLGTVGRIAYPGVMDTVALAAAAAATTSIGLFSNVMLGPVWPPVLLAKETAAIDEVSGGRLTLGLGVGIRPDDFVVDGLGVAGRGRRFDHDLEIYRDVWKGEPVGGGPSLAQNKVRQSTMSARRVISSVSPTVGLRISSSAPMPANAATVSLTCSGPADTPSVMRRAISSPPML